MLLKIAIVALAGLTVACSSTSVEHEDAGTECRGPGRYEAGKEGSYLPCCAGLTEVEYESAGYSETGPICWSPPLRVYACVQGTCGDGICEEGEAPVCGCVADCPSASWGPQDAGADVTTD